MGAVEGALLTTAGVTAPCDDGQPLTSRDARRINHLAHHTGHRGLPLIDVQHFCLM